MTAKTLKQALGNKSIRMHLNELDGKPVGGWAETQQAKLALPGALPDKSDREYTLQQLIGYAMDESNGRYRWREDV